MLKCKVKVVECELSSKSLELKDNSTETLRYVGTGTADKCVIADETIASVAATGVNTFSIKGLKAGKTIAEVYVGDSVLKCDITVTHVDPVYAWVKKGVVKDIPDPRVEGLYNRCYDADIQSITVQEIFNAHDNSGNKVTSTFTTRCTAPLDTLKPDDTISLKVSMNMSNKAKDVGEPYRIYVSWNGCKSGTVDYNGGDKFTSSKDMYLNCSQNQDFALNLDSDVTYKVPKGGTLGEQKAIVFSQFGGASIAWIYEWKQIN